MTQHNRAEVFLIMAHKDLRALRAMTGGEFAVEIFGFHAQQAAEKALKAWAVQYRYEVYLQPEELDRVKTIELIETLLTTVSQTVGYSE